MAVVITLSFFYLGHGTRVYICINLPDAMLILRLEKSKYGRLVVNVHLTMVGEKITCRYGDLVVYIGDRP